MTADPRVEAVAEALHASEHAGEMTRSCPAWDDAAIAVAAVRVGSLSERRPDPEVRRRTNNLAAGEASKRRAS